MSLHAPDGNSASIYLLLLFFLKTRGSAGLGWAADTAATGLLLSTPALPAPQPQFRVKRRHGGNQSSDWLSFYCPSRPFILLIIHRDQWVIQNYVALAAQIFSVYLFVYKRSQVIYIIFWPRGLLTLFGSLP